MLFYVMPTVSVGLELLYLNVYLYTVIRICKQILLFCSLIITNIACCFLGSKLFHPLYSKRLFYPSWRIYMSELHLRQVILENITEHAGYFTLYYASSQRDVLRHNPFFVCHYNTIILKRLQTRLMKMACFSGVPTPQNPFFSLSFKAMSPYLRLLCVN